MIPHSFWKKALVIARLPEDMATDNSALHEDHTPKLQFTLCILALVVLTLSTTSKDLTLVALNSTLFSLSTSSLNDFSGRPMEHERFPSFQLPRHCATTLASWSVSCGRSKSLLSSRFQVTECRKRPWR